MNKLNIATVLVTYNRLSLLKESISSIKSQSYNSTIIVIDNSSIDGTNEWLASQQDIITITQPNLGSSFGQYSGIKYAYENGFDWIWCMDDDSIPCPSALEELISGINTINLQIPINRIGFVSSKVLWKENEVHNMNIQGIFPITNGKPFNFINDSSILNIQSSSFVSTLFNAKTIGIIGYPIKEMFVWGDDTEYTERFINNNYFGFYIAKSVVIHKTPNNHSVSKEALLTDGINSLWKHKFGIRNNLYITKRKSIKSFIFLLFLNTFKNSLLILLKRKDHKYLFLMTNIKSSFSSLFFNPTIEIPKNKR